MLVYCLFYWTLLLSAEKYVLQKYLIFFDLLLLEIHYLSTFPCSSQTLI